MLSVLALSVLASVAVAQNQITVYNRCPMRISPRAFDRTSGNYIVIPDLEQNGSASFVAPANFEGVIYQGANPGRPGFGGATLAGFSLKNNNYFVIAGEFNTGIQIGATFKQFGVFCTTNTCADINCSSYKTFPTSFPSYGVDGPVPPLYACGGNNTPYYVTFCPDGPNSSGPPAPDPTPAPSGGSAIHPNYDTSKCLDVAGDVRIDGTAVQIYDCNGSGAQQWIINDAVTQVRLAGTNFCLDAGSNPGNGIGMKIWTCYDKLPAQTWYLTGDRRIALFNKGLCLDVTNGNKGNGNRMQTWGCSSGNTNQIWTN